MQNQQLQYLNKLPHKLIRAEQSCFKSMTANKVVCDALSLLCAKYWCELQRWKKILLEIKFSGTFCQTVKLDFIHYT